MVVADLPCSNQFSPSELDWPSPFSDGNMRLVVSLSSEPPGVYHWTPQRALLYEPWKVHRFIFIDGMSMKTVFVLSSQHLLCAIGWFLSISPIHSPWTCRIGEGGWSALLHPVWLQSHRNDRIGWDGMGWDGVRLGSNRVLSTIFVARAVYPCVDLT